MAALHYQLLYQDLLALIWPLPSTPQDTRSGTPQLLPRATPIVKAFNFAPPASVGNNASNMIFADSKPVGTPSRAIATAPSVVVTPLARKQAGQVQQAHPPTPGTSIASTPAANQGYGAIPEILEKATGYTSSTNFVPRASLEIALDSHKSTAPPALTKAASNSNEATTPLPSTEIASTPSERAPFTSSANITLELSECTTPPEGSVSKASQRKTEVFGNQQFAA